MNPRSVRTAAGAIVLGAALFAGPAGAAPHGTSLLQDLRGSLGSCSGRITCKTASVDAELARLGAGITASARGIGGPAAWLRLAARIRGLNAQPLAPLSLAPKDAILALYHDAGIVVDAQLVDARLRRVNASEARALGDLVDAFVSASRAAKGATRGSGLERIAQDPVRAMHLITLASNETRPLSPKLRAEYDEVVSSLGRINMTEMASAALTLADAMTHLNAATFADDLDLPLISIGHAGDTTYSDPLLIQIDDSGNDTYLNNAGGGVAYAGGALAIDFGSGDDTYTYDVGGQGWAIGATGILYDDGGTDFYSVRQFGQGASVAGVGLLYDAGNGNDSYMSPGQDPISAKASSLGGIGLLVDEGGSDALRQDGLDGFVYGSAGGLGLLANLGDGGDSYRSDDIPVVLLGEDLGKFTGPVQVSAEAGGTAILYEEGGDDTFQCGAHVRQGCQGAGGVGALSLLWDRGGNDTYTMGVSIAPDLGDALGAGPIGVPVFPMGQGIGYGPSEPAGTGIGILRDEAGHDSYTAEKWAQGFASLSGIGLLYDTGGSADVYSAPTPVLGARADQMEWFDGTGGFGLDR